MEITPRAEERFRSYRAFLDRLPDGDLNRVLPLIEGYLKNEAVIESSETQLEQKRYD